MKKKTLIFMADFETSKKPDDNNSVYAWLTGYKICGVLDLNNKWIEDISFLNIKQEFYYFGKNALKRFLNGIFDITAKCKKYDIDVVGMFYNLTYDGSYIHYHILDKEQAYNKDCWNGVYISKLLVDDINNYYSMNITQKTTTRVNKKKKSTRDTFIFKDLAKIFPGGIESLGQSVGLKKGEDFDYKRVIDYNYTPTLNDLEYFRRDIEIMCLIYKQAPDFFYGRYTIGSIVKNLYLEYLAKRGINADNVHPKETEKTNHIIFRNGKEEFVKKIPMSEIYEFAMKGYKGGMTISNNEFIGKTVYNDDCPEKFIPKNTDKINIHKPINHYDVNSLYPSVQVGNRFPIGLGILYTSDYEKDNSVEFEKHLQGLLKDNCIIVKINFRYVKVLKDKAPLFLKKECLRYDTDVLKRLGIKHTRDNDIDINNTYKSFHKISTNFTECLTLEELNQLKQNYEMSYKIDSAIVFKSINGLFDDFVNELNSKKVYYDKDKAKRLCYKLLMNNLYGKFGENPDKENRKHTLNENGDWYLADDGCKNNRGKFFYPPIAVYITSYARMKMMNFINLVGWRNVIYMDTDSIHLYGDTPDSLKPYIDNTKLGYLKLEETCFIEKTLAPKKYVYGYYTTVNEKNKTEFPDNNIGDVVPVIAIKCAGMPHKAINKFIKSVDNPVEQFHYGLSFIPEEMVKEVANLTNYFPTAKLAKKFIKGGIYLADCIYQIKIPDYLANGIQQIEFGDSVDVYVI